MGELNGQDPEIRSIEKKKPSLGRCPARRPFFDTGMRRLAAPRRGKVCKRISTNRRCHRGKCEGTSQTVNPLRVIKVAGNQRACWPFPWGRGGTVPGEPQDYLLPGCLFCGGTAVDPQKRPVWDTFTAKSQENQEMRLGHRGASRK